MEVTLTPMQRMYEISKAYERKAPREEIMALYEAIPDINEVSSEREKSYLHLAAENADPWAIVYLFGKGLKPMTKNSYQETALHYLAEGVSRYKKRDAEAIEKCADLLLGARVSALLRDDGSCGGKTAYHVAVESGNAPFIYAMIKNRVKLDMVDKDGRTILHLIATDPAGSAAHSIRYSNNEEDKAKNREVIEEWFQVAKALIEYGLDPDAKDQSRFSPKHYAIEKELPKLAILFAGEYDESDSTLPDKIASGGKTLHRAADDGDLQAVEALIRLGADPNEVDTTEYGTYQHMTPLGIACSRLRLECVKALLDGGADPNFRGGEKGWGAFYSFATGIRSRSSQQEKDKVIEKIVRMLFDAGLDPNGAVDEQGHTPINLVCSKIYGGGHYQEDIRRELFDMGVCDYNIPDRDGITPLMGIAQERWNSPENDLIALLEYGADMTARDAKGNTALMHAAMNQNKGIARTVADMLFSFGDPQPSVVNNEGKSAMDYAVEKENEDLVKYLLSKM